MASALVPEMDSGLRYTTPEHFPAENGIKIGFSFQVMARSR
jgi:hypothetical protein